MDGFFGIGFLELLLIAILALIVLGPERLPGVMREIAKYVRQVRKAGSEFTSQFSEELKALDELNPRKILNEITDPNRPEPGDTPAQAKAGAGGKPAPKPLSATPAKKTPPAPGKAAAPPAVAAAQSAASTQEDAPSGASEPPTENSILPPAAPAPAHAAPNGAADEAPASAPELPGGPA